MGVMAVLALGMSGSERLIGWAERGLFGDEIVHARSSVYQRMVVTRWKDELRLYLNGNLQFSSRDEHRYHEALVLPAMRTDLALDWSQAGGLNTANAAGYLIVHIGVLILMLYYGVKIKGLGGFIHELFCAPFGSNPLLWPANFLLNLIEYLAKMVSLGMRLFGNMYAGELLFFLIALMGGYAAMNATGIMLAFAHVIAGTAWLLFHILIVLLQAFIFMMLTLVYIGQAHEGH
jgi:hypothetical protein